MIPLYGSWGASNNAVCPDMSVVSKSGTLFGSQQELFIPYRLPRANFYSPFNWFEGCCIRCGGLDQCMRGRAATRFVTGAGWAESGGMTS